jgi:hypothetical protein
MITMASSVFFLFLHFLYVFIDHSQWKHKNEDDTVVGNVVNALDIALFPILQNRLEEEDGPITFNDLEAHAGDQGTPLPEPTPNALIHPHPPFQSYSNMKRAKRRMNKFQESGRQTKTKKLREHVQLCQDPAVVDGFDAETLPAASGAYSSLRLGKKNQRTPEIEKLIEQGYQYVAAQDVGDSIK